MLEHSRRVVQSCVITRKWCSLAVVYGQMYLKSVTLSSFGHGKKYWSRLSERDKFCKRNPAVWCNRVHYD